jgi:hypothetical protein
VRPAGVRIRICREEPEVDDLRHRAGNDDGRPHASCPNCGRVMFHVFDLDLADPLVAGLHVWDRERLVVRVCPSCALYFEPYWVVEGVVPVVIGGARDGGRILQDVRPPYPCRAIELRVLHDDDYPTTPERARALRSRLYDDGVYHQLGGVPVRGGFAQLECCTCARPMKFAGVVDYDDLNVPLYEDDDRRPVALVIGDGDCLDLFTCAECGVVGLSWAKTMKRLATAPDGVGPDA